MREHKLQRQKWRRDQQAHRASAKTIRNLSTPLQSPNAEPPDPVNPPPTNKSRGRKRVWRDRTKAYQTINNLQIRLKAVEKSTKRVQKRYE